MTKAGKKTQTLGVSVPLALRAKIVELADKHFISKSRLATMMLVAGFDSVAKKLGSK